MPRKDSRNRDTEMITGEILTASPSNQTILSFDLSNSSSNEISSLLELLIQDHQSCMSASKMAIMSAIAAGRKIRAICQYVGHGNVERIFDQTITPKTSITLRTGQRYVKTANDWDAFIAGMPEGSQANNGEFLDQNLIDTFRFARTKLETEQKADPNDWTTPIDIIRAARLVLGAIDCDPCASNDPSAKPIGLTSITRVDGKLGGLSATSEWKGGCWIAPGHRADFDAWIEKSFEELEKGSMTQGLLMVPAAIVPESKVLHRFPFAIITQSITVSSRRVKHRKDGQSEIVTKDIILPTSMAISYLAHTPSVETFEKAFGDMSVVFAPVNSQAAAPSQSVLTVAPTVPAESVPLIS